MSMRIARTIALAAGAGALVLGMAAPAMADDDLGTGASKVSIVTGATQDFTVPLYADAPETVCPANVNTWSAKTASKNMKAITVSYVGVAAPCNLTIKITANNDTKKRNAVVKIIGTNTGDPTVKVVKTVVVKVTGKTKPGNGPKNN